MDVHEYETRGGISPFAEWFETLDGRAAAKVVTALTRLGLGNTSHVKGVGAGVFELKINYGPGYRVYFGKDGASVCVLLGGGTKQRQQRDIRDAQQCWHDFRGRKKGKA